MRAGFLEDLEDLLGAGPGGGVTDHGALTGLGDDDHAQYHTDGRADSWLATKSAAILALLLGVDGTTSGLDADLLDGLEATAFESAGAAASAVSAHEASFDHGEFLTKDTASGQYELAAALQLGGFDITDRDGAEVLIHVSHINADGTDEIGFELVVGDTGSGSPFSAIRPYTTISNADLVVDGKGTGRLKNLSGDLYLTETDGALILAALLPVDGHGSGLDANTLQGNTSAAFEVAGAVTAHEAWWDHDSFAPQHDVTHSLPRRKSGEYFCLTSNGGTITTVAGANNRLDFWPFSVQEPLTIDNIHCEVTTGVASALARISIYVASTGENPDTEIDSSGDLDCSTTGAKNWAIGSFTFLPGFDYWIAFHTALTATYRAIASAALPVFGCGAGGGSSYTCLRTTAHTFAGGPPATPSTLASTAAAAPKLTFRQA